MMESWLASEHFDCRCGCTDHDVKFAWLERSPDWSIDEDEPDLWLEVQMHQYRSVWRRLWLAAKYVCGYGCAYGHWDCWTLAPKDIGRLHAMIEAHETRRLEWAWAAAAAEAEEGA